MLDESILVDEEPTEEVYVTRSGRRRRLVSEPATIGPAPSRRVKTNSGNNSKYSTVVVVRPSPIIRTVKPALPKSVAVTTIVENNLSSNIVPLIADKNQKLRSISAVPIVRSLDSGISLGGYVYESTESGSSRSSTSDSKVSTPNGSKRSSPTATKFRPIPMNILQSHRNGENPNERQLFVTSESPNSFNTREVSFVISYLHESADKAVDRCSALIISSSLISAILFYSCFRFNSGISL